MVVWLFTASNSVATSSYGTLKW
eukprot:COSAG02_NODE_62206_length_266_cov_0.922156_1_plen_22_part_10